MTTEIQTFKPKNFKTVLHALMSLAFVVSGIFLIKNEPVIRWTVILFFGICLLVFIAQLIPGSTELKLTKEGFIITSLFQKNKTLWTDVESFKIGYLGPNKAIMLDYNDGFEKHQRGKLISKRLSGSHGALPTTYGLKATELLKILNEWKNKYGKQQNKTINA